MRIAPLVLAAVMAGAFVGPTNAVILPPAGGDAGDTIDGNSVEAILELARGYGDADLAEQSNGDPQIRGSIDGLDYSIYFRNCTAGADCADINFTCAILGHTASLKSINAWNQTRRFGKAYLNEAGETVVAMDVNMESGVSTGNLRAGFAIWQIVLGEFASHVSFTPEISSN